MDPIIDAPISQVSRLVQINIGLVYRGMMGISMSM